jgi:hypothetical protein
MEMSQKNRRLADGLMVVTTLAVLAWVFWPTFVALAEQWTSNPLYSMASWCLHLPSSFCGSGATEFRVRHYSQVGGRYFSCSSDP